MAEASRNTVAESVIPTGLNRIKTRRVASKDRRTERAEDSANLNDLPNLSTSHVKRKEKKFGLGRTKINFPKEGRKARRIARWFSSQLSRYSNEAVNDVEPQQCGVLEGKEIAEGHVLEVRQLTRNSTEEQMAAERTSSHKLPKGLKSFSHELGPKGGIPSPQPRARSFDDMKELLGSLCSRFDAAKEIVNTELDCFSTELMEALHESDSLTIDGQKMAKNLLVLAKQCIEMETSEFRTKCEEIVKDLTLKRQQCQTGLLKWLLTRMLFILTRCTRLLHFEKDTEPVDGKSLYEFQKCLESIPSIEVNWFPSREIVGPESGYTQNLRNDSRFKLKEKKHECFLPQATQCRSEDVEEGDRNSSKNFMFTGLASKSSKFLSNLQQSDVLCGDSAINNICNSNQEQDHNATDLNSVICRICEELVPIIHLESHSYICAYADKCDLKSFDVNERLWRLAELLEQLVESRNLSVQATDDSPVCRMHMSDSAMTSEGCSPKLSEWRSRGVEEMFEDLHEMDTACLEESPVSAFIFRGHLGTKLNLCRPPSSTGSMTSVSSTNTPRAGNFDLFWLDHNNPSDLEDVKQMADLADIARCAAGADLSTEWSNDFLLACMQDLQDLLQHSKLKALVMDTFGSRIENLLREKFILACNLVGTESDVQHPKSTKVLLDNASHSSTLSTPSHPLQKERITINDFEIIKPISRGAFGKVYLARKRTTGDLFAIKVLNKMDMLQKNDIDRILAERNILITVRNPFVVRFFYSFTSRDHVYLVMEYLNGGDLYSLLQKINCLGEDVARIYISELVLALEYLHSLGIVHRDLKPDNILIAQDGHIKLTDFGLSKIGLMNSTSDLSGCERKETTLSKILDGHTLDSNVRSQRSAVGTPDYLAPEILLGTQHGYAADWWSVGIILFELITGFPPFTAELPEVIFDNILNKNIPWPSVPSDMSSEAQDLIDRLADDFFDQHIGSFPVSEWELANLWNLGKWCGGNKLLSPDPNQRLGAKGASEVKVHPFFTGVDWDNLTLQKAAFVPQPDSIDDTSYFVPRYNSTGMQDKREFSDTDSSELCSDSSLEKMDECGDLAEFNTSHLDLSLINFSFKNLSQLASINHDVVVHGGKDSSKRSSPCKNSE